MTRKWQQALRPLGSAGTESKDSAEQEQRAQAQRLVQLVTRREKRLNQRQRRKKISSTADKGRADAEANAFGTEVSAGARDVGPSGEPGSVAVSMMRAGKHEIGNAEDDVEEALESLSATTYSADAASPSGRDEAWHFQKGSRRRKLRKRL